MGTKFGRKSAINDARRIKTLSLSVPVGSSAATGNADTVDSIHASTSPTVNFLLALDGSALFPDSVIASTIARDAEVTAEIATHAAIDNAHHEPVTAGDGIALTGQQIAVDLSATSGLEFSSGDLQIADAIAGAGLTISSKVLAVGAGDGIDVAADSIAVDVTDLIGNGIVEQATNDIALGTPSTLTVSTSNGVTSTSHTHAITSSSSPGAAASLLASNASGYLQLVRIGLGVSPTVPLDVSGNARINGDLSFVGAQSITTTAGNLTLAPAGDFIFNPTGNDILPETNYDLNVGSLSKKYLTLHCAELWVETLVAQDTIATIGGRILVGPTTVLTSDLASGDTTVYVKHNEMASGDRVYMEADGKVEFMAITGAPGGAGPYSYTVTRNLDGTGANQWYAGDAVFNTGTTGEGFIDLYSVHGIKAGTEYGPTIVGNMRNSATYNDWTPFWAIGNLDGVYGYSAATYGVALGKYQDDYITIESTNGIRMYSGSTQHVALKSDGTFWAGDTASTERLQWDTTNGLRIYDADNAVVFRSNTSGDTWLSSLAISEDLGQMFFSDADGLLLLGPGCKITDTAWTSTRGQVATISGAFHQVPGRFPGTRALAVEPTGTNYTINPIFGVNVTDGWTNNGMATYARSTTYAKFGAASMRLVSDAATDDVYSDTVAEADGGENWTAVVWVYLVSGDFQVTIEENNAGWSDKASQAGGTIGRWERVVLTATLTAGVTDGRVKLEPAATAASEFYIGYVGFHPTAYALSAIYGSAGTGYAWTGTAHNSTSTRTATEVNLDAHVGLISANDTLTIATWVQMPYDADATWAVANAILHDMRGADNNNRIYLDYAYGADVFHLYVNGAIRVTSAAQTTLWDAGAWKLFTVTVDFTNDIFKLYIDAALIGTSTTVLTAPVLTDWLPGQSVSLNTRAGFVFDEYAVFDDVLTASEIAAQYALQRPLTDCGAVNKPGIFILDGQFDLASSLTGARVRINTDGISAFSDESGNPQSVKLDIDGDFLLGSNVTAAATTALAVFANAQTYNSESFGAGDLLIGDNSASKANVFWDRSAGKLQFRGGTTMQCEIGTDGKLLAGAGAVTLGSDGIIIEGASGSANQLKWKVSGTLAGYVLGYETASVRYGLWQIEDAGASVRNYINIVCKSGIANGDAEITLESRSSAAAGSMLLKVHDAWKVNVGYDKVSFADHIAISGGLYVGNAGGTPDDDDVHIDGSINTSAALGCRVYNNANISIPNATATTLTYNSERFDDDSIHSTASNTGRLTCVHAGVYLITATVRFAANATGTRYVLFLHEGTTEIARHRISATSAGATVISLTTTYKLAATDYVQCRVYQNSGGALNVEYSADYSPVFGMTRLP